MPFNLFGNQAQMPGQASQPSGLARLLQPEVGLPMAAALLGNQGNMANLGNAFGVGGQALQAQKAQQAEQAQQNKTYEFFKQNAPEFAQLIEGGAPVDQVWKQYTEQRFAQAKDPYKVVGGQVFNTQDQSWIQPPDSGNPEFRMASPDEAAQYGAQAGQFGPDGRFYAQDPPSGMSIESDGQGGFSLVHGPGAGMGNQDNKNVANRITAEQEGAASASSLKQTVGMLRKANQNTGYSGPGAGVYGAIDDFGEQVGADVLPGNASSRATMRSGGLEVALAQVQKTKGAISNAEMALFMAAAPGMQNTPQGNAALLDILDAVADRQIMRASEAEKWRQQNGSLNGFESAWGQWTAQNPLLADNGQGGVSLAGGGAPAGGQPPARRKFNPVTGRIE